MKTDFSNMAFPTDKNEAIETYFNLSSPSHYRYNLNITDEAACEEYANEFRAAYPSYDAYMSAWRDYMTCLGFKLDEKGNING